MSTGATPDTRARAHAHELCDFGPHDEEGRRARESCDRLTAFLAAQRLELDNERAGHAVTARTLVEATAEVATLDAPLVEARRELTDALAREGLYIDERDAFESQIGDIVASVGLDCEWSNLHGHRECVGEAFGALEQERDKLKADLAAVTADRDDWSRCHRAAASELAETRASLAAATAARDFEESLRLECERALAAATARAEAALQVRHGVLADQRASALRRAAELVRLYGNEGALAAIEAEAAALPAAPAGESAVVAAHAAGRRERQGEIIHLLDSTEVVPTLFKGCVLAPRDAVPGAALRDCYDERTVMDYACVTLIDLINGEPLPAAPALREPVAGVPSRALCACSEPWTEVVTAENGWQAAPPCPKCPHPVHRAECDYYVSPAAPATPAAVLSTTSDDGKITVEHLAETCSHGLPRDLCAEPAAPPDARETAGGACNDLTPGGCDCKVALAPAAPLGVAALLERARQLLTGTEGAYSPKDGWHSNVRDWLDDAADYARAVAAVPTGTTR